jgi:hypothetical protein
MNKKLMTIKFWLGGFDRGTLRNPLTSLRNSAFSLVSGKNLNPICVQVPPSPYSIWVQLQGDISSETAEYVRNDFLEKRKETRFYQLSEILYLALQG